MFKFGLKFKVNLGFYNSIGRVFDCDSKNIGSIPIKNPELKNKKEKFCICFYLIH